MGNWVLGIGYGYWVLGTGSECTVYPVSEGFVFYRKRGKTAAIIYICTRRIVTCISTYSYFYFWRYKKALSVNSSIELLLLFLLLVDDYLVLFTVGTDGQAFST